MKQIKQYLLGIFGGVFLTLAAAGAQEAKSNSIESMTVAQQGGVLNVKLTFTEPLTTLPPGFSVAVPARIALDFANTTNALGKNSQTYNEGDLKSVNVVQAEGRTRLVLNLNRAMTYESSIDGKSLLLVLVPSADKAWQSGGVDSKVEHFAQARPSSSSNSIRDIAFRRGKDGEARITVDLSDPNAGIVRDVFLTAMRDIKKDEEITFDYSVITADNWTLECKCGSPRCRKVIGNYIDLSNELKRKYDKYTPEWIKALRK